MLAVSNLFQNQFCGLARKRHHEGTNFLCTPETKKNLQSGCADTSSPLFDIWHTEAPRATANTTPLYFRAYFWSECFPLCYFILHCSFQNSHQIWRQFKNMSNLTLCNVVWWQDQAANLLLCYPFKRRTHLQLFPTFSDHLYRVVFHTNQPCSTGESFSSHRENFLIFPKVIIKYHCTLRGTHKITRRNRRLGLFLCKRFSFTSVWKKVPSVEDSCRLFYAIYFSAMGVSSKMWWKYSPNGLALSHFWKLSLLGANESLSE